MYRPATLRAPTREPDAYENTPQGYVLARRPLVSDPSKTGSADH